MTTRTPKRRSLAVAACFALGIASAHVLPPIAPLIWLAGATACLLAGILTRRRSAIVSLAAAAILLGAAAYSIRIQHVPADHIARRLSDRPALLTVEGTVLTAPTLHTQRPGTFGRFVATTPSTTFQLSADTLALDEVPPMTITGRLLVGVTGDATAFRVGDRVRAVGMARTIAPPTNPGEPDRRLWAASQGIGGTLDVDASAAITRIETHASAEAPLVARARRAVEALRLNARAWIEDDATSDEAERRARALLRSLLLGTRERDLGGIDDAFTRLGLAHILAISGFNLTLLAGTMFILLRVMGDRPRTEALVAALAIVVYLLIIPVHAPVLRAAVMVLAFLAGETAGRRYDALNILGWTMVVVLLAQPIELLAPGFQLSFGVVAALLTLARPVRTRLFGERPQRDTIGTARAALEWLKDASAASLVAWAVASPIIAHHVGVFSPLGALWAVLLTPLVALIMGVGYVALLVSLVAPPIAAWAAPPLIAAAEWLVGAVMLIDSAPGSAITLPKPSVLWTLLATGAVIWWLRPGGPTGIEGYSMPARLMRWCLTLISIAWLAGMLFAPALGRPSHERLRLDTIDVADGSCHLVRVRDGAGREECILFDCGSLRLTIGERTIPSALSTLGVWRVRTVVLSHPNIDHYGALLDIAQPLGVRRVVVGEAFARAAAADPDGPVGHLLAELRRMEIEVREVAAGDIVPFEHAPARLEVLSPPRGARWTSDNNASLVCRLCADHSPATILFTGDIQPEAILALRDRHQDLSATVLEVPHHGSYNGPSTEFVISLDPPFVIQSTGPRRLDDPRWAEARAGRAWFTTAGVGAISLTINSKGEVTAHTWRKP